MGRRSKTQDKPTRDRRNNGSGQIRIIGGRWRGSKLLLAPNQTLRPSTDRSRETLFNWLTPMLPGSHCVDLFAGSGALGLEAASRGAAAVTLIEKDAATFRCLQERVSTLEDSDCVTLINTDAHVWLTEQHDSTFDLVLLDPPFNYENYQALLEAVIRLLSPTGWLYLETERAHVIPMIDGLRIHREKSMGQVAMTLYQVVQ